MEKEALNSLEKDYPLWDDIKTPNNIARKYFWTNGLTYDDISKVRWRKLIDILLEHLNKRNIEQEKIKVDNPNNADYTYKIDRCIYNKPSKNRPHMTAFIYVKVDNYSVREGISFNGNNWIGFAGWASTYNTIPFTEAFKEWVDWVITDKNKE